MATTIEQLAHRMVPGAQIGDRAAADRMLRRHNVVGMFRNVAPARDAIARLEDIAGDGGHVQFVGFDVSTRQERDAQGEIDPEGVTGLAGRRIALGGAIGGVVGAAVIGTLAFFLTGDAGLTLASALASGLILGVIGALLANFAKYGAGDAWRQTFQPAEPTLSLVAVLTDDQDVVAHAADILRAHGAASVELRDREGEAAH
jgi:hypothetical protein